MFLVSVLVVEARPIGGPPEQDEQVVEWSIYQLNAALNDGDEQKALMLWERGSASHASFRRRIGEYQAWHLARIYTDDGKFDQAIHTYKDFYADRFPITVDERARLGEQLIFGSIGGSKISGAIGKAQCPLCHVFKDNVLTEPKGFPTDRAPSLFNVYRRSSERLQDPRYHRDHPHERDTKKKEACPGCGTATTAMEYLAESVACPNCYIVTGYGLKGTHDTDGGCPVIHKPPISISIPELIAVETWILKQEGIELPFEEMRSAHEKFIPKDERPGIPEGIKLASLYEAKGDYAQAMTLIEVNYPGLDKYGRQPLMHLRDNLGLFSTFRQRDDLVERFPLLLQSDAHPLWHLDASKLGIEYEIRQMYGGEAPRWSPDGKSLLFTDCYESECQLRLLETDRSKSRVLVKNAAYGDWSPDGKQIVYLSSGNLVRKELLTGEKVVLGELPPHTNQRPRWSPDGTTIELLQRLAPAQSCRKVAFSLYRGTWMTLTDAVKPSGLSHQPLLGNVPYDVVAHNEASLFCSRPLNQSIKSLLRRLIVLGQVDKVFSLKPFHDSEKIQELVWLLNKEDDFALLLLRNARNVTVSPDGRWVAYEFHVTYRAGNRIQSITNLHIARLREFPQRSHEFVLKKGSRDGLKKGMILDVFRNEGWQGFPPIGSVQVVQVFNHQATVKTVIETHHVRESNAISQSFEKPVETGDRVIIPGTKQKSALLGLATLSSLSDAENE